MTPRKFSPLTPYMYTILCAQKALFHQTERAHALCGVSGGQVFPPLFANMFVGVAWRGEARQVMHSLYARYAGAVRHVVTPLSILQVSTMR